MSELVDAARHANLGNARDTARRARKTYPYRRPAELDQSQLSHHPVLIVGAGPVGLALALDLARRGVPSVILEMHNTLSAGSRAICWSKRSLEICNRLGVGDRLREKGVMWNVGKVYAGAGTEPLYSFDLLPDKQQKYPAFVNLQQYYAEEFLIDEIAGYPAIEVRWQHEVVATDNGPDGAAVTVRTQDGDYRLSCDYLVAADGHRSPVRKQLGLDFEGRVFEDHFLIADVKMQAPFPAERRFWFDPPFNPGQTALLHKQADDVWRIDFQMGWDIDRDEALQEENVGAKVRAFLGDDIDFEYDWVSIYTFQCRRMADFIHDRVIFVGDAAHLVSPFGARGANGGLQDADNLAWKLALVLNGEAPPALLATYNSERVHGADENIRNSTRSTDFMTPKSEVSRAFRDAALELAAEYPFARGFVNSGRLSVPCVLDGSPLNTADGDAFSTRQRPGSVCTDAPVTVGGAPGWLLEHLGDRFVALYYAGAEPPPTDRLAGLAQLAVPVTALVVAAEAGPGVTLVDTGVSSNSSRVKSASTQACASL